MAYMSPFSSPSFQITERLIPSAMEVKYRALVPELYREIPQPPKSSKVIVIGSGFGGAISAYRLAEAGIQVTVLERGQDWPIDPWREIHTYEPSRDGRGLWHKNYGRVPVVAENGPIVPVDFFGGLLDVTGYRNIEI